VGKAVGFEEQHVALAELCQVVGDAAADDAAADYDDLGTVFHGGTFAKPLSIRP
jgi:hypothetical protein